MAKLYFKYGAMGSSKSAQALITKFNYEELGMSVWLIKPSVDTRDGADAVKSRIGLAATALFIKLSSIEKLKINLGEGVPPAVAGSFNVMIPMLLTLSIFGLLSAVLFALMMQVNAHLPIWAALLVNTLLLLVFVAVIIKRDLPLSSLPVVGRYFRK